MSFQRKLAKGCCHYINSLQFKCCFRSRSLTRALQKNAPCVIMWGILSRYDSIDDHYDEELKMLYLHLSHSSRQDMLDIGWGLQESSINHERGETKRWLFTVAFSLPPLFVSSAKNCYLLVTSHSFFFVRVRFRFAYSYDHHKIEVINWT